MINNELKKIKIFKSFFNVKKIDKIDDCFITYLDNIFFVGNKEEKEIFLLRYTENERDFIEKYYISKHEDHYIIFISNQSYSLSYLLPQKNDFYLVEKESNILVHIPHDSIVVPEWARKDFVIKDIDYESLIMSDWKVGELIWEELYNHSHLNFNLSRIVLDVERYRDDENEPMSKYGMGKLYTSTSEGLLLRNISDSNKIRLEKIYDEYHLKLKEKSKDLVEEYGEEAIIVDFHSFPNEDKRYQKKGQKPDICLGFNDGFNEKKLNEIKSIFEKNNFSVKFNNPYSGSIVPDGVKIDSIMIEVNRKLYLDENYAYFENSKLKDTLKKMFAYLKVL